MNREYNSKGRGFSPEEYYRQEDHLAAGEKEEMWRAVSDRLSSGSGSQPNERDPHHTSLTVHWKSFWMGQAAAVLLLLAVLGGYSLWQDLSASDPYRTELERTYRSSLEELATTGQALVQPVSKQQQEVVESHLKGLEDIDRMIEEIRSDMLLNGSTYAKRQQLRRLYATKLNFVQKLILTEEVTS